MESKPHYSARRPSERRLSLNGKRALIAQYAVGLLLIIVLLALGDVSQLGTLLEADIRLLVLALICTAVAAVVTSYRWGLIVRDITQSASYPSGFFLRYVLLGQAASLLVPQDIGSMGTRTASLAVVAGVPTSTALYSVILDRLLDLLIMAALSLPALLFLVRVVTFEAAIALALLVLCILAGSYVLPGRLTPVRVSVGLYTLIVRLLARIPYLAKRVPSLSAGSPPHELSERVSLRLTLLTVIRFFVFVIRAYLIGLALGSQIPLWVFLLGMPLAQLSLVLAITPAGLGTTELGWYAVLVGAGVPDPDVLPFVVGSRAFNVLSVIALALVANFAISPGRPDSP